MQLLKIGNEFINMDLVVRAFGDINKLTLYFAVERGDHPQSVQFSGAEAEALLRWLGTQAQDLMAPPSESPGVHF